MGDNPTSQQGSAPMDFRDSGILINASQIPDLSALYATQAQLAALSFAPIISPGYQTILNYDNASTTISNSVAEATLTTFNLPANTLGTRGLIRVQTFLRISNNSGGAVTYSIFCNWGGTRYFQEGVNHATGTESVLAVEFIIASNASTTAQHLWGKYFRTTGATNFNTVADTAISMGAISSSHAMGSGTKNTANIQTIAIKGSMGTASASAQIIHRNTVIELYQP